MDYYGKFLEEKYAGKYSGCRYPNLVEIYGGMPTYYFAKVTPELMLAVFRGEEDLTLEEIGKIAHYNGIPLSVLTCPKLITLSRKRLRHWQMMNELNDRLYKIWEFQKKGSKYAENYMVKYVNSGRGDYVNMDLDFRNGRKVIYGHYLVVRHKMDDTILFAKGEFRKEPRGLSGNGNSR